jgi:type IV pilus assembly protein PilW
MTQKNRPFMQRQQGMTLIEVLIALTIGLVILIAIGTAYLSSTNMARQRENQSELNEPAAIVIRMLQRDVANAGYVDIFDFDAANQRQAASLFNPAYPELMNLYQRIPNVPVAPSTAIVPLETPLTQFFPGLMPVFGCDGAMNSTPNAITNAGTAALTCGTANATKQSLQVAYQAAPSSTANPLRSLNDPNAATGEGRDCNQQALDPAGSKFVINRYFVQASSTDGVNELYCAGSGNNSSQPLARGVEEFVLRYQTSQPGVAPAVGSISPVAGGIQAQYLSATAVAASSIGWANVTAVEVCMISATATGAAATGTTALQTSRPTCERTAAGDFKSDITRATGDTRLWKRFTSTISVRNAIYASPN